jgi:hypothetical protein
MTDLEEASERVALLLPREVPLRKIERTDPGWNLVEVFRREARDRKARDRKARGREEVLPLAPKGGVGPTLAR